MKLFLPILLIVYRSSEYFFLVQVIDNGLVLLQALRILSTDVCVRSLFCRRAATKEIIYRMLTLNLDDLHISRFLFRRFQFLKLQLLSRENLLTLFSFTSLRLWTTYVKNMKKLGGHRFCFGDMMSERSPKTEKTGFVSAHG